MGGWPGVDGTIFIYSPFGRNSSVVPQHVHFIRIICDRNMQYAYVTYGGRGYFRDDVGLGACCMHFKHLPCHFRLRHFTYSTLNSLQALSSELWNATVDVCASRSTYFNNIQVFCSNRTLCARTLQHGHDVTLCMLHFICS